MSFPPLYRSALPLLFAFAPLTACGDDSPLQPDSGDTTTPNDTAGTPNDTAGTPDLSEPDSDSTGSTDTSQPSTPDTTPPPDTHIPIDPNDCGGTCSADQVCVNNACQDLPNTCPCPTESYCDLAANRCVIGCVEDEHCANGRLCDNSLRECWTGCRNDEHCASSQICEDSSCRTGCRADEHCANGQICEDSSCRAGCRADEHCANGQICEDSSCRAGCRSNAGCASGTLCNPQSQLCVPSLFDYPGTPTYPGDAPWHEIITDDGHSAIESGPIDHNQTSVIAFTIPFTHQETVSFDWTVSSESSWDKLCFCVTQEPNPTWCPSSTCISGDRFRRDESGQLVKLEWESIERTVPEGTQTLVWIYSKDTSTARFEDRGWVKNIRIGAAPASPYDVSYTNDDFYAIPDNDPSGGVISPITVSTQGTVVAVAVDVKILHTYRGDLTLWLEKGAQSINIYEPELGDDSEDLTLSVHPVIGFEGTSAQGTWNLRVTDKYEGDVGFIDSWTLHLNVTSPP